MTRLAEAHPDESALAGESQPLGLSHGRTVRSGDVPENEIARGSRQGSMNQGDRAVCVVGHGRTQIPGPAAGAQKGISFSGKRTGSLAIAGEPLEVGPPVRPERSRVQLPHPAEAEFSEAIERFRILQGRPSLPSVEIRLRHEPELFVNFPSVRGRVEFDAPDAGTKIVDAVMQQAGGATQAAEVGVHQDHSDPADLAAMDRRRRRARGLPVEFQQKAPIGFAGEKPLPVVEGLIPASQRPDFLGKVEIVPPKRMNRHGASTIHRRIGAVGSGCSGDTRSREGVNRREPGPT